jgi:NAD(P)-dependent dehydrogenase (short-subunit alcohol dehydrogenase family)
MSGYLTHLTLVSGLSSMDVETGECMARFDGKVAIVTGAGRGIGRAEALLLAAEGAAVVVNDRGGAPDGAGADAGPAQQVADEIVAGGGAAVADTGSVSSWSDAEALVGRAVEVFGGLDVVINNAGILRDRMSFNMDESEWDSVIDVHLKGHFCVARHAAAYWRARSKRTDQPVGAALVNTSSESGLYGNAGQLNYAAAKAGIASMTIVLARELERIGVRVNAIAPVARTRLTEAVAGDAMRPGEDGFDRFAPENVAAVACWLASDLAAGLNGQVVKVQGGVVQLLEGWRPLTEATTDKPWTIDSVDAATAQLLARSDGAIPPFFFPGPA